MLHLPNDQLSGSQIIIIPPHRKRQRGRWACFQQVLTFLRTVYEDFICLKSLFLIFPFYNWECWGLCSVLTILCRVNDGCKAVGSFSLAVKGFHFDFKLRQRSNVGVFVDIMFGLGISYCYPFPLQLTMGFKGNDVTKICPKVVLRLHWLKTKEDEKKKLEIYEVKPIKFILKWRFTLRYVSLKETDQAKSTLLAFKCILLWSWSL